MPIKGLSGDAQFDAQLADLRFRLPHRGHCQTELGGGHCVGPAAVAASGTGGGHACLRPLDDQLPLELGQGGVAG